MDNDPFIPEQIDQNPVVHTPLHIAAISGNTYFAMELAAIKPSFARKLNHLGLSPIHLALENGNDQLERSIMTVDPELVRVKSKGRVTPLHYVAADEMEKVDLLAEFLSACPSCIEDLTIQCETAVHVAVKNKRFVAFKILFGWLMRVNKKEILNWKDEDGNTVLHIATATNQPEVMIFLMKNVNKNAKNLSGLTAMDMYELQSDLLDEEVGKILRRAKAKRAFELTDGSTSTLVDYLSRDSSLVEKRDRFFRTISQPSSKSESDLRNYVLVVAILIATASYQAVLSPPGGFWQDNYSPSLNNTGSNYTGTASGVDKGQSQQSHSAGKMILRSFPLVQFIIWNTLALHVSVFTILIVIIGMPYCTLLSISITSLLSAYHTAMLGTLDQSSPRMNIFVAFIYLAVAMTVLPSFSWNEYRKLKQSVDNPTRRLGGLYDLLVVENVIHRMVSIWYRFH